MVDESVFYSKLLLFGEYSIISGSRALALPLKNFSGRLRKSVSNCGKQSEDIRNFCNYLYGSGICLLFDLERLQSDLDDSLFFESDIPQGYGVGSSAALCASIYSRYAINPVPAEGITNYEMSGLKEIFSAMESFFHGKSSGLDPLVSYIGKPLLIDSPEEIVLINDSDFFSGADYKPFLYDSGTIASTSPLVAGYMANLAKAGYSHMIEFQYLPVVNSCIDNLLNRNNAELWSCLMKLSAIQLGCFSPMIPDTIVEIWEEGLSTGKFCFKLCGSGGGGFFLVFGNPSDLEEILDKDRITSIVT